MLLNFFSSLQAVNVSGAVANEGLLDFLPTYANEKSSSSAAFRGFLFN